MGMLKIFNNDMSETEDDESHSNERLTEGIERPDEHDVVMGRGGMANNWSGNKQYRRNVDSKKEEYVQSKRARKTAICKELVERWYAMDPPGRFIEKDSLGLWNEIGEVRARRKTSQLLREDAPTVRDEVEAKASNRGDIERASGTKRPARGRSRAKAPKRAIPTAASRSPDNRKKSASAEDVDPWFTAHIEPVLTSRPTRHLRQGDNLQYERLQPGRQLEPSAMCSPLLPTAASWGSGAPGISDDVPPMPLPGINVQHRSWGSNISGDDVPSPPDDLNISDFFGELGEGVPSFDSATEAQAKDERGSVAQRDGARFDAFADQPDGGHHNQHTQQQEGEGGPSSDPSQIDTHDHTAV